MPAVHAYPALNPSAHQPGARDAVVSYFDDSVAFETAPRG